MFIFKLQLSKGEPVIFSEIFLRSIWFGGIFSPVGLVWLITDFIVID